MEGTCSGMTVGKTSNWNVVSGSLEVVVDVVLDDGPAPGEAYPAGSVVLEPAVEPGYCEITVEFQRNLCTVRNIWILSDSRQCEVYFLVEPRGEVEYLATARGELYEAKDGTYESAQEFPGGPLYEAEIELVDSQPWAGIKVRLLSLLNRSRVNVKKLTIMAAVGPVLPLEEEKKGMNDSNLLKMMMPSVLQMLRGIPDKNRKTQAVSAEVAAVEEDPSKVSSATQMTVDREEEKNFRSEMSRRLQGLEVAVGSIDSYLREAFSKLDDRMGHLESQVSELRILTSSATDVSARIGNLENQASELWTQRASVLNQTSSPKNVSPTNEDTTLTFSKETAVIKIEAGYEPFNAEVSKDTRGPSSAAAAHSSKGSSSFERAWSSSLAKFSMSAALNLADEAFVDKRDSQHLSNGSEEEEDEYCTDSEELTSEADKGNVVTPDRMVVETAEGVANNGDGTFTTGSNQAVVVETAEGVAGTFMTGSNQAVAETGTNQLDLIDWSNAEDSTAFTSTAADQPPDDSQVYSLIDCTVDMPTEASDVEGIPTYGGCEQGENPLSSDLLLV